MEVLLIMTLLTTKTVRLLHLTREQHFGETETKIQFFGLHSLLSILTVMRIVHCDVHIIKPLRGIWDLGSKPMKRLKPLPIFRILLFYQSAVKDSIYECSHYQLWIRSWLWKEKKASSLELEKLFLLTTLTADSRDQNAKDQPF
ncbi:hypothetical protein YC2023_042538 [Brassica napus]